MLPVFAIVGRPNVGKSTLFNYLTRTRDALVADEPGVTRDRLYGNAQFNGRDFIVIDTGGLETDNEGVFTLMASQVRVAVMEADVVIFVVDGKAGINVSDELIAKELRQYKKNIIVLVNKIDGRPASDIISDFYKFGFANVYGIAAANGQGIKDALEKIFETLPPEEAQEEKLPSETEIKLAIVGKPNAGKSTLINRILGEERVIVYDEPGTTRDSIYIPFIHNDTHYTLIDTAGVRRRTKIHDTIEKFSVVKTLQAIRTANVVLMVFDAREGISEQDMRLLSFIIDAGKSLVIAINKWDNLPIEQREMVNSEISRRLGFVDFARLHYISALHGTGVGNLLPSVLEAYKAATKVLETSELTALLERAIQQHQPPMVNGRRIKLRYAHSGGNNPPVIVIHGNQLKKLPGSYNRYLVNFFRKALNLIGTPIRIILKTSENPYTD